MRNELNPVDIIRSVVVGGAKVAQSHQRMQSFRIRCDGRHLNDSLLLEEIYPAYQLPLGPSPRMSCTQASWDGHARILLP